MQNDNKPAIWFWVAGALALIWNLLGVGAYIGRVTMSPETLAAMPEAEQAMINATPTWYMVAFAVAVFSATLACIALLLKKRLSIALFVVSLVAVLLQQLYHFVLSDVGQSLAGGQLIMTLMIPAVSILLIWMAKSAASKGWLS